MTKDLGSNLQRKITGVQKLKSLQRRTQVVKLNSRSVPRPHVPLNAEAETHKKYLPDDTLVSF